MNKLTTDHYRQLLGLDSSWSVKTVDFFPDEQRVSIQVVHVGEGLNCAECGDCCPRADMAPERTWRHLDTMQFKTEIRAATPRSQCRNCGVKTIRVPWAQKHSRFTLLFEAFAIDVLKACANVKRAATLLGIDWSTAHAMMTRAVERGLAKRQTDTVVHVGIDEKSFGRGHDYVSVMTDIGGHRVLEISKDRTIQSTDQLWESLPETQRKQVQAVAMDMWQPFLTSTRNHAPEADIVHDKFHVAKYLNEAVDKVRRKENKTLNAEKDERLKGTKQLWLFTPKNMSSDRRKELMALQQQDLKTSRAWAIKEHFRHFWDYVSPTWASKHFQWWYGWAVRCRLKPIADVAKMLKRHLPELMTYFSHRITNAMSEGFNSRIQSIKSAGKGFRVFKNYRIRILFYCGKLQLEPVFPTH